MEVSLVLGVVFAVFVLGLFLSARAAARHYSGERGEWAVAKELSRLPQDGYYVVNDLMLPTKDGATTQVDHVVVSRFGIFVIETKDYSGWIFGREKGRQWTQAFPNGDRFKFQNPLRQNWWHIYVMAEILEQPTRVFRNIVVFAGDGELQDNMPENVIYVSQVADYIRSFKAPVLSEKGFRRLGVVLRKWDASVTEERRQMHVRNLNVRHDPVCLAVSFGREELCCPRCGSKMVLRHRRTDGHAFYGCSAYPKCKGIIDASSDM